MLLLGIGPVLGADVWQLRPSRTGKNAWDTCSSRWPRASVPKLCSQHSTCQEAVVSRWRQSGKEDTSRRSDLRIASFLGDGARSTLVRSVHRSLSDEEVYVSNLAVGVSGGSGVGAVPAMCTDDQRGRRRAGGRGECRRAAAGSRLLVRTDGRLDRRTWAVHVARADSEIFDFTSELLTLEKSDFNAPGIGVDVGFPIASRLDVLRRRHPPTAAAPSSGARSGRAAHTPGSGSRSSRDA